MFFTVIFVILALIAAFFAAAIYFSQSKDEAIAGTVVVSLVLVLLTSLSSYWTLNPNYYGVEMQYGHRLRIVLGEGNFFSSPFSLVYKGEISPTNRNVEFSVVTADNRTYIVKAHATTVTNFKAIGDYLDMGLFYLASDVAVRDVYFQTIDEAVSGTILKNLNRENSTTLMQATSLDLLPEAQAALTETLNHMAHKPFEYVPETLTSLKIVSISEKPMIIIDDKKK